MTHYLLLGQLREDIAALQSLPDYTPTNIVSFQNERGEALAEFDSATEDDLRAELKGSEEALELAQKSAEDYQALADKAEEETEALRAEMDALKDPTEDGQTVATYRERTKAAEKMVETWRACVVSARRQMADAQKELKAIRARKGAAPGVCRESYEILSFLNRVAREDSKHKNEAARILNTITP